MKSITIHGIDANLYEHIKQKAKNEGLSINKTIKELLGKALGFGPKRKSDHCQDFLDLFGTWTKDETEEFAGFIKDFENVDAEDWK